MYINSILRFLSQSYEGKLYHPDADLEILDDKVDDTTDDNDDNKDDKENKEDETDTDTDDDKEKDDDTQDDDENKDKEDEDKEDDEDDQEEDEDSKDDEESEDDDTEIVTEAKQIKAKYPEFFKEFPDVRNALYRAQAYSGLFGTIKDAESAKARSESLGAIEQDLFGDGNPTKLLDVVEKADKEVFEKISLKILPYLQEKNKELYFEVAALPIKQLLRGAYSKGGKDDKGNLTNLAKAALVLHQYFFDDQDLNAKVKAETGLDKKESDSEKEYRQKIEALNARELKNFNDAVDSSYVKRMDSFIREGLDKDDRLSDYSKNILVREVLTEIKNQLQKDSRYMTTLESLHKQANRDSYSNDSKSRIVSTALARAKSLVPEIRKKLVSEMLGSSKKKKTTDTDTTKKFEMKKKTSNNDSNRRDSNKPDKSKSDLDILKEA